MAVFVDSAGQPLDLSTYASCLFGLLSYVLTCHGITHKQTEGMEMLRSSKVHMLVTAHIGSDP